MLLWPIIRDSEYRSQPPSSIQGGEGVPEAVWMKAQLRDPLEFREDLPERLDGDGAVAEGAGKNFRAGPPSMAPLLEVPV